MPYISRAGTVQEKRSPWRLSIVWEGLLALYAAIMTFIMTMISPQAHDNFLRQKVHKKRDPPSGGGGGGPRVTGLDNIGGGGGKHLTPGCAGGG